MFWTSNLDRHLQKLAPSFFRDRRVQHLAIGRQSTNSSEEPGIKGIFGLPKVRGQKRVEQGTSQPTNNDKNDVCFFFGRTTKNNNKTTAVLDDQKTARFRRDDLWCGRGLSGKVQRGPKANTGGIRNKSSGAPRIYHDIAMIQHYVKRYSMMWTYHHNDTLSFNMLQVLSDYPALRRYFDILWPQWLKRATPVVRYSFSLARRQQFHNSHWVPYANFIFECPHGYCTFPMQLWLEILFGACGILMPQTLSKVLS